MITAGVLLLGAALLYYFRRQSLLFVRGSFRVAVALAVGLLILGFSLHARHSVPMILGLVVILGLLAYHYRQRLRSLIAFLGPYLARPMRAVQVFWPIAVRLRLHVVFGVIAILMLVVFVIWWISSSSVSLISLRAPWSWRLAIAVIGFAAGYLAGLRLQSTERSSPVLFGLGASAIFFMLADYLIAIAIVGLVGAALFFLIRDFWPTLHQATIEFSKNAGSRFQPAAPEFSDEIRSVQEDHDRRLSAIKAIGLEEEQEEKLLTEEHHRYVVVLHQLSAGKAAPSAPVATPDVTTWFDPPENDGL